MRVKTIQIVWHESKPIYTLDFHCSGVLATGGGDNDIKVRHLELIMSHAAHLVAALPKAVLVCDAVMGGECPVHCLPTSQQSWLSA